MKYLNSRASSTHFRKAIRSNLYVDKTLMIEEISKRLGTADQYVCITRPRRFGKTVNANMLAAYYTQGYDSKELFDGLYISESAFYGEHQNLYPVIHIDFSRRPQFCDSYRDYLLYIIKGLQKDLEEAYPQLCGKEYDQISDIFEETGDSFVFILDEWDSIFYQSFVCDEDRREHLNWLKGLLKDQPYVELAYMTGVLPIAKYSSGSELNMFDEYNFMNDNVFDRFFGFSEIEVRNLCEEHPSVPFEVLKEWYDGYYLSDGSSLFNPRSVNKALSRGVCLNYWTETGPMNEIADCIENNVEEVREDIVKMVSGIPVEVILNGYSAAELRLDSRDEILSAMVVYGFLAYHDQMLSIPNAELMEKFQKVLARESMQEVKLIVDQSKEILEATLALDENRVAMFLEEVHDREIPFLKYKDENSLSCVITLCYLYARNEYRIEREQKSGKGYCDYLFIPKKSGRPAIILELKFGKSCEEALAQIKEKNYMEKVKHCREVLLVGITYDNEKHHSCRIEKCYNS